MSQSLTSTQLEDILRWGKIAISGETITFKDSHENIIIQDYNMQEVFLTSTYSNRKNNVSFSNCTICGSFSITNFNYFDSLNLNNCIFEGDVNLDNIPIPLIFSGTCHFKGSLHISSKTLRDLTVADVTIEKDFILEGNYKGLLTLKNINTTVKSVGIFSIINAKVEKLNATNIHFSGVDIKDNTEFEAEAEFEKLHCQVLAINNITIGLLMRLKNVEIEKLTVDNLKNEHRYFYITDHSELNDVSFPLHMLDNTDIQNSKIDRILIWGTNQVTGIFNIEKTSINNLLFEKIYNEGLITLRELDMSTDCILTIKSSNLGRTDFILCDFSKAILEFENSKMSEVFLSETDFPLKVRTNKNINWNQAQLAFGQLHTAFQKQGDTVRAIEYQAREIESHYNELKNKGRHINTFLFDIRFPHITSTTTSLALNKLSTNFGRNWVKGVIFTIIGGVIFFYLLVVSSHEYEIGFPITFHTYLVAAYLKFLNPLRFFDTESLFKFNSETSYLTLTWRSYLCDFLGRIFIAYGFYQTIQAFRRFGRK